MTQAKGGAISPANTSVQHGSNATFTISADKGYAIKDVLVDGTSVGAVSTYIFSNVTKSHTITAVFEEVILLATGFIDVRAGDWFAGAVQWALDEGIMNGTSATTFAPQASCTRAMVLTILYRQAGSPNATGSGTWYDDAAAWAVKTGVSDGTSLTGDITREQLVTMLWRADGKPTADVQVLNRFADGNRVSDWAKEAVAWAISNGILEGKGQNQLDPTSGATRAETATIFMRLDKLA